MSTNVISTHKPAQVVATATAVVEADKASWDEIVEAGLAALGEVKSSLFGYGVKANETRIPRLEPVFKMIGTFVVYAYRD